MLSFNDVVVTRNNRISIEKGQVDTEGEESIRNWKLVIRNVRVTDEGNYMCQLNTDPAEALIGYLEVTSK